MDEDARLRDLAKRRRQRIMATSAQRMETVGAAAEDHFNPESVTPQGVASQPPPTFECSGPAKDAVDMFRVLWLIPFGVMSAIREQQELRQCWFPDATDSNVWKWLDLKVFIAVEITCLLLTRWNQVKEIFFPKPVGGILASLGLPSMALTVLSALTCAASILRLLKNTALHYGLLLVIVNITSVLLHLLGAKT